MSLTALSSSFVTSTPANFPTNPKLRRKITHHNTRPRPEYPLRRLKSHRLQIENPRLCRRMNHRKLPRDLIRRNRQILPNLLGIANDIQILARRLHHNHIRALLDIPLNRAPR